MRGTFPQYSGLTDGAAFKQVTADYWRTVLAGYEGAQAVVGTQNTYANARSQALTDGSGIG